MFPASKFMHAFLPPNLTQVGEHQDDDSCGPGGKVERMGLTPDWIIVSLDGGMDLSV